MFERAEASALVVVQVRGDRHRYGELRLRAPSTLADPPDRRVLVHGDRQPEALDAAIGRLARLWHLPVVFDEIDD